MKRITMIAVVAAAAALAANAGAATPKLTATVLLSFGMNAGSGGKKVTRLKAGTYTILVKDEAGDHDFRLSGPGVDKATSVAGEGTFRWRVKLKPGTYTFVCDPHASFMKGAFTVS